MSTDHSNPYRIYILTCWLESADDRSDHDMWRFRLDEPRRGRRHGYIGVKALVAGLISVISSDGDEE